jgi:hypothetical protein
MYFNMLFRKNANLRLIIVVFAVIFVIFSCLNNITSYFTTTDVVSGQKR